MALQTRTGIVFECQPKNAGHTWELTVTDNGKLLSTQRFHTEQAAEERVAMLLLLTEDEIRKLFGDHI